MSEGENPGLRGLLGNRYQGLKKTLINLINHGERFATPVGSLAEDYPQLVAPHTTAMKKYRELYGISGIHAQGLQDAIIREVFNSRERNRFGIKELNYSRIKAVGNKIVAAKDPEASHGLGNVKANRITQRIYDFLPDDIKAVLLFDKNSGHVDAKSLAHFLNPGNVSGAYTNSIALYSAVFAASRDDIVRFSLDNGFNTWQERYVTSTIICCSDPLREDQVSPEGIAYDNGYLLLRNKEYALSHFTESKDAILQRQALSDKFFSPLPGESVMQ